MMRVGIVGLPNAGKSSLFNLLTDAGARVDSYPFTTIDKNVGVVGVPDDRLEQLARLLRPKTLTPAHFQFADIAGLVEGASRGEGLGNRFLANIRESDLLLHLVRNFSSVDVAHAYGDVRPDRDAGVVEAELALSDLAVVERRLEHVRKEKRTPESEILLGGLERLAATLSRGFLRPDLTPDQAGAVRELALFVLKPIVYAVNCSDRDPVDPSRFPKIAGRSSLLFSAALEEGMRDFPPEERVEMRRSLGLAPEGPAGIVTRCFELLDLIRFYTVKGDETRAWSAPRGTHAVEAAAMIHSDMADGFIKAEVVGLPDLVAAGGFPQARSQGRVKIEGRNYVVGDGDVLLIRFRG